MSKAKELYTRAEAAERLGVNVRTIDRLIKAGRVRVQHAALGRGLGGTRLFIPVADLDALTFGASAIQIGEEERGRRTNPKKKAA